MKKLLFLLLVTLSYGAYAADSTCVWEYGNTFKCKEDRSFEGPDMEKAGRGLMNILRWLNENSTSNTNTQPKSYGGNNTQVYVPPNAYETYYNGKSGFACNVGYTKSGNSCIKNIYIPPNAYASGSSWICKTGYKRSGNSCVRKIVAPANGYVYGNSFECVYGYKKSGNSCVKTVIVPENGYASGNTFECFTGYKKTALYTCEKIVVIPTNGYASANGFKCLNGYKKVDNQCIKQTEKVENIVKPSQNEASNYLEKISQAKSLLDSGIISEEEFSDITKRIIEKSQESSTQLKDEEDAYKQLLVEEIELEKKQLTDDQINTLKSAYVNNIAAEVKSYWRYQGSEDDWTCEVYVIQDRDGTVVAADVTNCNVGDSSRAKSFRDSIERAVYKASPLPVAPDEAVFEKEFIMTFSVN